MSDYIGKHRLDVAREHSRTFGSTYVTSRGAGSHLGITRFNLQLIGTDKFAEFVPLEAASRD